MSCLDTSTVWQHICYQQLCISALRSVNSGLEATTCRRWLSWLHQVSEDYGAPQCSSWPFNLEIATNLCWSCVPVSECVLSWRVIVIIIIVPLSILSEDECGDLECLYLSLPSSYNWRRLIHRHWVDERGENERQSENASEMKPLARSRGREPTRVGANKTKEERIVQREKFWV